MSVGDPNNRADRLAAKLDDARDRSILDHEDRIRTLEAAQARYDGASSGLTRAMPWITLVLSPLVAGLVAWLFRGGAA